VTIVDVARHAGVAPSTVSYALTGRRRISPETRNRVLESVRALGYHRTAAARSLNGVKANVLALLLPWHTGLDVPSVSRVVTAVMTEARRYEQDVMLVTADQSADSVLRVAGSAAVDGLIVMDVETRDERLPALHDLDRPSVLIGTPVDADELTCVDVDFAAAGAWCVDHLADLGHRRVGLLGAPGSDGARRIAVGFMAAGMRRDIAVSTWSVDADRRSVQRIVADQPALTGLVVHGDAALKAVLETLRALGRRVPEDIDEVVISPDGDASPLTSVHIPVDDLGRAAVGLLMRKLGGDPPPPRTLLPPVFQPAPVAAPQF